MQFSASEMTYTVSSGALNSTQSSMGGQHRWAPAYLAACHHIYFIIYYVYFFFG